MDYYLIFFTLCLFFVFFIVLPQAESTSSAPSLTTVSLNEAADLFVTAKATDPKEPIRMDLSRPPPAPQRISSASTDGPQGEMKIIGGPHLLGR